MSVSSLPEWKQLLLEKKKREEVERGRREKEEEEKLASMPAWKRGIIQRRRAKDFCLQVLLETIVPVHENPFIRTQSGWKKGRDGEPGTETEVKERDKMNPRGQDAETRRSVELKKDRFRDLNEGWEKERSRDHLSRIESLREKMRQKELEKMQQGGGGGAEDGEEACDQEDRYWERGSETQKEQKAVAAEQRRPAEADVVQEETAEPSSMTASDVRQEVCVLKTCPQLPVSLTQADTVEEVTSDCATTASEVISDSFQISEHEEEPLQHVDQLRHSEEEEQPEEEEEEEEEEYSSSFDSEQSLSPSPPHPNSLAAMSRIYNLETVGSRSGLCLREKTVEISSSVHLVKVKPLVANSQQGDVVCDVQTIQQQIEQLQLKEQEALRNSEGKGHQSPKAGLKHQRTDNDETPDPKAPPHPVISPTPQPKQTITIVPSFLRNQSSENSLKPANCAPTPASSPSSLSPAQSPCPSPSPTPSPVLFSIKSASGGHVKRGATITVTPKKPCGGGGGGTRPALPTAPTKPPPQQTSPATADPGRKKYPTVEEIEVIGGYQNLERSCLIKSRGTPKRGKVCFHEDQLEQVCEYPSETSMLTFNPLLHDGSKVDKPRAGEVQEEEGEAEAGLVKSTRSVGIAPRLRVGQCHPQLNKHKVEFLSRAKDSVVLRKPVRRELYSICGNVVQHLVI
uniref:Phostensin/Taperin PP1-binding domain-containing protein n=1 Tax=Oryzias latipes TaxID=8090 RepID=A0A3P9I5I3_ORYLA